MIRRVLDKIDEDALQVELRYLREKDAELDAIREDVQAARQHVSFWDRVNVFTSTENEQVLKQHKRELKEVRKHHSAIIHNIKSLIREAMDLDGYVRMKVSLGEIANDVERLRVVKRRGTATEARVNQFEISGLSEVHRGIDHLDRILAEESGIAPGKLDENAVVGLVYDEVLRAAGFIND